MPQHCPQVKPGKTLISLALAAFTGGLFPLGFAPLSLWPLSLIAIAVLWLLLQGDLGHRRPFFVGWIFGLGSYGVGASWIFVSIYYFGQVSLPVSLLVTFLFVAGLAVVTGFCTWGYQRLASPPFASQGSTVRDVVRQAGLFTACWVVVEWMRTWLLSGFPWLYAGYAGIDTAYEGFAPILGVFGVSALMVLSTTLVVAAYWHREGQIVAVTIAAAIWLTGLALTFVNWTRPDTDSRLTVYLLQGNIPQEQKRDRSFFDEHLQIYLDMTNDLWSKRPTHDAQPHVVIWPEAALPHLLHNVWDVYDELDKKARANNAAWISGAPWVDQAENDTLFHNGILAAGIGSGFYVKQKLVPFGESLPVPDFARKWSPLFNLSHFGFSPGSANQRPLTAQGLQIAPFICYEIVFPGLVRRYAADADLLLTVSNDGWFGQSFGPDQHFQMARMRALESGKVLLRDTNNGITAIIDEHGKVIERLETFTRDTLSGTAYRTIGKTPFILLGSWPTLLVAFGVLAAGVVTQLRRRSRVQPSEATHPTDPIQTEIPYPTAHARHPH